MNKLNELFEIVKLNREVSAWTKDQTSIKHAKELFDEIEELKEAIKNNNIEEIKNELGDVLWDTLMLMHIFEEEGKFTKEDVINNTIEKIKRRKPHIFENKLITKEEEEIYWQKIKKLEKLSK